MSYYFYKKKLNEEFSKKMQELNKTINFGYTLALFIISINIKNYLEKQFKYISCKSFYFFIENIIQFIYQLIKYLFYHKNNDSIHKFIYLFI